MKSVMHDPKEKVFILDDIRRLIVRHRRKLLYTALIGAIVSVLGVVFKPPVYKIEATFKEGGEQTGVEYSMKDFLLSGLKGTPESQAFVLMKTHQVMKPVIEKHGLQVAVLRSVFGSFFRQFRDHILSQFGLPIAELDWFTFKDVDYQGEEEAIFSLCFTDKERFQVLDEKGRTLAHAAVGKPVILKNSVFTCFKTPSNLRYHTLYWMKISPWLETEEECKKKLLISRQKTCSSIYDLIFYWPDRFLGAEFLNDLMKGYRLYLKQDRDEIAKEQLAYLEAKQIEICKRFEMLFDDHAAYLTTQLKEKGLIGLEQEMRSYLDPHEEMKGRLLSIDMELERLEAGSLEYKENLLAKDLGSVFQQLRSLENEKAVLLKSLPQPDLFVQGSKLTGEETFHLPWQQPSSLEGIDLDSARNLYTEYANRLDAVQASKSSLAHIKEKIEDSEFEIASLSSILKDPLSQTLIARASELSLQLREVKYSSTKERERWKEEIDLQKTQLMGHLDQLQQIETLNEEMIRDKITALQKTTLDGIDKQMSALQQQIQESTLQRSMNLQDEKKLLHKKMEQLKSYAADLPQRWKKETWLELKTDMAKKIMMVMAELVESKTIGRHLLHIESKPLDLAIAPFIPCYSMLLPFAFIGAFCSAFAVFWGIFLYTLTQGFPLTGQKLSVLGYPYSGKLSSLCDGPQTKSLSGPDLETLRQIHLFLQRDVPAKVIALIGERGPNYSYSLAKNLKRAGNTVCIVDCDFRTSDSDGPGFLQWLHGEIDILPIHQDVVDTIASGGFSPFGCEAMQSKRFEKGLEYLKKSYDYILFWQRSPINGADATMLLKTCQKAVVLIEGEQTEQLTPLLDWAYHDGNSRITFISSPG